MKKLILFFLLLICYEGFSQPLNYSNIRARYRWYSGMFDSALYVPRYNGTPSGVRVSENSAIDGAIAIDTANSRAYIYSGGAWVRIANFSEVTTYTAGDGLLLTGADFKVLKKRSITIDADSVMLENDTTTLPVSYFYGSNSAGRRGWYAQSGINGINIYNSNGTLTSERTLTGGGYNLNLNGEVIFNGLTDQGAYPVQINGTLLQGSNPPNNAGSVLLQSIGNAGRLTVSNSSGSIDMGRLGVFASYPNTNDLGIILTGVLGAGAYISASGSNELRIGSPIAQNRIALGYYSGSSISFNGYPLRGTGTTSATNALLVQDTAGTELMRLRDDGKMGIGSNSPDSMLTVEQGLFAKRGVRFSNLPNFADTSSWKPLTISSTGDVRKATYWPGGGGGGTPAGNYGNVQVNRNGSFDTPGSDSLTYTTAAGLAVKNIASVGASGNGQLTVSRSNTDYTNTGGAGSVLHLKNPSATGQNVVYSEINGNMVAKWRTDYVGNISWVSSANTSTSGHNFYINGDYPGGSIKMSITNTGTNFGTWTGSTPTAASNPLTVTGNADITGKLGIGITSPTALLHIKAGTASANTAPLKFTTASAALLTTPEAGAVEVLVDSIYYTGNGGTRNQLTQSVYGSGTLDFGNTAAQTSADLTIVVMGAADGDVVSLGVPNGSTNANSCFTAWVSAANTITVRFNNYSAGAIDPASGTFKLRVIK